MSDCTLCGDNDLYEHLRQFVGRRVKGAYGFCVLKEVQHRLTPAGSGGVTFHGAAEHGTHLEVVSSIGRPTSYATAPTTLSDSSVSATTPALERVFDDDIAIMKRLCVVDTRADDSKSGLVYGAVTPRITALRVHTIGGLYWTAPTPVGGSIDVADMRRFGIAGHFGYVGAGCRKAITVSPYLGMAGRGQLSTSGLSVSVSENIFSTTTADRVLGNIIRFGHTSGQERYLSCGIGGTVTVSITYFASGGADPIFTLIGIGQDGARVTLSTAQGDICDVSEYKTITLTASTAQHNLRLAAAYVTANRSLNVSSYNGVLTCGNSSRTDLQCSMSIEGMGPDDAVTFEGSSLYVGAPAEPALGAHVNDEGIDLDAIVEQYQKGQMRRGEVATAYGHHTSDELSDAMGALRVAPPGVQSGAKKSPPKSSWGRGDPKMLG